MMSMERGLQYEKQIRSSLEREGHQAKLWSDVPEEWLEAAGIIHDYNRHRALRKRTWREGNPLRDTGVDLVVKKDGDYELIQCKNYTNMLCQSDLAGFFRHIAYFPHLKGSVYHSDARLSCTLEPPPNFDRIKYVHEPYVPCVISDDPSPNVPKLVLRDYQRDAVTAALKLLTGSAHHSTFGPRTMLNLACGCGKTICAATVAKSFERVVVFSPTKVLSEQNLKVFSDVLDRYSVLVDSDGIRDVQVLKGDLKVEEKWLISATFKSADVIQTLLENLQDLSKTLIVIDEVHGLSRAQVTDDTNPMNKILWSKIAILSMSATPRIYELDDEDTDYEDLFGPICYQMNLETAIERGLTTDYRVYIPLVHEIGDENEIMRECGLDAVRKDTTAKCTFLLKGMLQKGVKRCIVYLDTHDAIEHFYQVFQSVAREYYGLGDGFWASALTSDDGPNVRKKTLDKFATFEGISIILSSQILNEGIDVVSCDSVFFASPCRSKIRIVQRVCRANRVDPDNPGKVAHVFVWADELDECVNLVGALKEFDSRFCEKVDVISRKYATPNSKQLKARQEFSDEVVRFSVSVCPYAKPVRIIQCPVEQAKAVIKFACENFRLPSGAHDKSLTCFLSNLKKSTALSRLTAMQKEACALLNMEIPTWHNGKETKYLYRAKHVIKFIQTRKRLPVGKAHDPYEKSLGKWLSKYRQLQNGTTPGITFKSVTSQLDIHLPHWKDAKEFNAFQQAIGLVAWVRANNMMLPIRKSSSNSQSLFLKGCRSDKIGNTYETVKKFLDKELPLWDKPHEYDALWKAKQMVQIKGANNEIKLQRHDKYGSVYRRMRSLYLQGKYPYSSVISFMNENLPDWTNQN